HRCHPGTVETHALRRKRRRASWPAPLAACSNGPYPRQIALQLPLGRPRRLRLAAFEPADAVDAEMAEVAAQVVPADQGPAVAPEEQAERVDLSRAPLALGV